MYKNKSSVCICMQACYKYKYKWLEGYPQHWRTGEELPLFAVANFPSPQADLLALHHICSIVLCLLPPSLLTYWPTAITCWLSEGEQLTFCVIGYDLVHQAAKPCLYATQCKPEAISITSEIFSLDGALSHFLAGYYLSMYSMLSSMLFLTDIFTTH